MATTVYQRYLEAEVLGAHPVKLVLLLYRGAIRAAADAARHLQDGDLLARTREINRAWAILQELSASLDRTQGAEISTRLASLYAYMQGRLIQANAEKSAGPLHEVESLLTILAEAWEAAHAGALAAHPQQSVAAAGPQSYQLDPAAPQDFALDNTVLQLA